jgi:hypothetical protein
MECQGPASAPEGGAERAKPQRELRCPCPCPCPRPPHRPPLGPTCSRIFWIAKLSSSELRCFALRSYTSLRPPAAAAAAAAASGQQGQQRVLGAAEHSSAQRTLERRAERSSPECKAQSSCSRAESTAQRRALTSGRGKRSLHSMRRAACKAHHAQHAVRTLVRDERAEPARRAASSRAEDAGKRARVKPLPHHVPKKERLVVRFAFSVGGRVPTRRQLLLLWRRCCRRVGRGGRGARRLGDGPQPVAGQGRHRRKPWGGQPGGQPGGGMCVWCVCVTPSRCSRCAPLPKQRAPPAQERPSHQRRRGSPISSGEALQRAHQSSRL